MTAAVVYRFRGWTVTLAIVDFDMTEAPQVHCPCGYHVDDRMIGCPFCWSRMPARVRACVQERVQRVDGNAGPKGEEQCQ